MDTIRLENLKLQYNYHQRKYIEKSTLNEFEFFVNKHKHKKDQKTYILYGKRMYEANFNYDSNIIRIQEDVYSEKERELIKKNFNCTKYEVTNFEKIYIGIKLENLGIFKRKKINIQCQKEGFFINPNIDIENNKATIIKDNEIIGKVNDYRNVTLINSINKSKDIVTVKDSILNIYTFKKIIEINDKFTIRVICNDATQNKKFNKIKKLIEDGCKFNSDEIWLFLSEDMQNIYSVEENSMSLILPTNLKCKCILDGNELKIKQIIDNVKKTKGPDFLIKINKSNLEFKKLLLNENIQIDNQNDGFNDIVAQRSSSIDFLNMIRKYEETEIEILEEIKNKCSDLEYSSIQNNKFFIKKESISSLENWIDKQGVTICYKEKQKKQRKEKDIILGVLKEVGEDYIIVDFNDDMVRSTIPRNNGKIGISIYGDEVIHERRNTAISTLENGFSPIENLASILNGDADLEVFQYNNLLQKYELGNLSNMQISAIEGALNTPEIFLIQGPPGTGKTSVIRNIVRKILDNKQEVLVTSFQNLAIDNILDGFLKENIIPYRFGEEDNPVMKKICSEISEEINACLRNNIAKDKEEKVEEYREKISKFRGSVLLSENSICLSNVIENILDEVEKFDGITSQYIQIKNIYESITKKLNDYICEFNLEKLNDMMPSEFGFELSTVDKFEDVQKYLENINKNLESKNIFNIIKTIKNLQEPEILFTLKNEEYQEIKKEIFDELKLVRQSKTNNIEEEVDIFSISIKIASILDKILENIPEYIEDDNYRIIKEFHYKISNNPLLLEDILRKYPDIRGTTCQKTGGNKFNYSTKGINYHYVIVDEAGRANPLDLLIPLVKGYKIILVGDHKQLPHIIETHIENKIKENNDFNEKLYEKYIKESLFGRLFEQLPQNRKIMLDTQYRMSKEIGDLVSRLFYDGNLKTGTDIINDTNLYKGKSLVSINVDGKQQKTPSGSWTNIIECSEIISKLKELDKIQESSSKKISVGIISFYKAQVEYIRSKINKLTFDNIEVDVGTVDAYQGLEKDIIFISSVRTDGIGFISNPNRLNVSLSRARKLVVIFGDLYNLNKDNLFKEILSSCVDGGSV